MKIKTQTPKLLILNQMAGPMTWELAEDAGKRLGLVAVFTGHPDTLAKGSTDNISLFGGATYHRGTYFQRSISWLQYFVQGFFWVMQWPKNIPILIFSNPPILCWLGLVLKLLRHQHYSVMIHDIYPNVLINLGNFSETHLLARIWYWLNKIAYEQADVVMTLGEYMAKNLELQFDSSKTFAGKVEVVYPWVDSEVIKPIIKNENWFALKYNQVDKLTIMYSGNMGIGHDIETILKATKKFQNDNKIHFLFIGMGPKWSYIEEWLRKNSSPNVTLLGWQPEENLPFQLACADLGVVSLEKEMTGLAIPSKAIYMLSAGVGIIALSEANGELTAIEKGQCGYVIEPNNLELLITTISKAIHEKERIGKNARTYSDSHFSRQLNSNKVLNLTMNTYSNNQNK